MSYPEQIRKQIEEGEELERQLRDAINPDTPSPDEGTQDEPTPEPQPDSGPEPTPEPTPEPEPENPAQAEIDALKAELEKERQRFRTLEGKYKAEPAQMREEIAQLREQVAQLSKPKEEKGTPTSTTFDFDAKEEEYQNALIEGDIEKIKAIRREIRQAEQKLFSESIQPRIENVEKVQTQTVADRFISSLAQAIPDWEQLNYDPNFADWLAQNKVQFSNNTLQDALNNAAQQYDSATAIQIFNAYKEAAGLTKPPEPEQKPTPTPDVAPPKSRTAAPPTGKPEPKMWTQAEVTRVYNDATRGKYSPEAWAKLEAEINQALIDGRVR